MPERVLDSVRRDDYMWRIAQLAASLMAGEAWTDGNMRLAVKAAKRLLAMCREAPDA